MLAETCSGVAFYRPYQRVFDPFNLPEANPGGGEDRGLFRRARCRFRVSRPVEVPPRLLLAAPGPRMQDFAAAEVDTMALH